jgi:hypothetical protein
MHKQRLQLVIFAQIMLVKFLGVASNLRKRELSWLYYFLGFENMFFAGDG